VHQAEQPTASAVTGREHVQQAAHVPGRAERAVRLWDYFALQLHFADVVAAKAALPLTAVVEHYTNVYRRFGFGIWPDAPRVPEWDHYTAHLQTLATHDQRLSWTQTFYAQLPPERLPAGRQQFGCFGCDPPDADGRVRIHFTNHDTDGTSPLSRAKMGARRQELQALFTYIQQTHAETAHAVLGGSWLYHLDAYRRLFPPVYGASRVVQEGNAHLQGQTCWGQFLDHRGAVRPALRAQLLANLATVDLPRLWEAFPVPTYTVQAPIQAFYDLYQVGAQP
jgi:hypothetical protein